MIWIRIVSKDGAPATSLALGVPLAAPFGDSVGDIGRGVGCTLVLPDPNREISRKQALVTWQAGRHLIRPIGSNVDIVLNGRVLPVDVDTPLEAGAEIRVGPYVMRVETAPTDTSVVAPQARPAPPAVRPSPTPAPAPARPAGAPQQPAARPLPFPAAERAPATPVSKRAPPAAAAAQGARAVPPVAPVQKVVPAEPQAPDGNRPAARPAAPSPSGAAIPPAAARSTAANDEFVSALYDGLGLPVPAPAERSAQKARLIGELLRESLAGTIELLAARQIAKKNLGASATMLQTRGNNPLKFSPNVDAALTHLLGAPLRGFIGPRDAVHDALGDLRAHQVAMLAGMRAALEAVLQRFDPVALEARLAPKGVLDQLMPLNRRARLWETFGEQYASILREVEDDWDALFGRAFLQAYERQLAELARAPTVDGDSAS